jgi:7-cyano-7-deazaguanine synthase in queuosine biosynthesis
MGSDRLVRCGAASGATLPGRGRGALCLNTGGDDANVHVKFEDVRTAMWKDLPAPFLDLIDVATYVYVADQASSREGTREDDFGGGWRRRLHFAIPVRCPALWQSSSVRTALLEALSFLTEDEYHFHFEPWAEPRQVDGYFKFSTDRFHGAVEEVMLFSGGLDSFAGAAEAALGDGKQIVLVNHRPNPKLEPVVRVLARELGLRSRARPPILLPVRINKRREMTRESTQRSRSLLFVALGAAFAATLGLDRVYLYENGVLSLNLPVTTAVVGSRASRTTHPLTLRRFGRLLALLSEKPFRVENRFQWLTKADVLRRVAAAGCADLIGQTRSCAAARRASHDHPHCGLCSQCIDQRFGVLAAGLGDHDPAEGYAVDLFTGPRSTGPSQTLLAVYAETASQVAELTAPQFLQRYGEIGRALAAFDEAPEIVAQQIFQLHRRHAQQVVGVLDAGCGRHMAGIRQRTLPPTCLVRMVCGDLGTPSPPSTSEPSTSAYGFRKVGNGWEVRFAGRPRFFLNPSVGAAYLHLLLQQPGKPIRAVDLAYQVAKDPTRFALLRGDDIHDVDARAAYRVRLTDLNQEMENARRDGNSLWLSELEEERQTILVELQRGQGLGRRSRRQGDDRERVRKAVYAALRRVRVKIAEDDAEMAQHLRAPQLRGGAAPCYQPPPEVRWET